MRASLAAADHPQAWTIERIRQEWEDFDWTQVGNGELWSGAWGGSDALWTRTAFPRIQRYLHVERGLEIAPGFGRLTHHLRQLQVGHRGFLATLHRGVRWSRSVWTT